jgi:hypothetical protein
LKDFTSVVKKELINFEIEGKRGPNLEKAYNELNKIPLNSVEAERFSLIVEILELKSDHH